MNMRFLRWTAVLITAIGLIYGANRTYRTVTGGFAIDHIYGDSTAIPTLPLRPVDEESQALIASILQQPLTYLSKGSQSYVFTSQDEQYVIKFIKHQCFRTKPWLNALAFIPWLHHYQQSRQVHKTAEYVCLLTGWQTAYNHLSEQTGILWMHLDVTTTTEPKVVLIDKVGFEHTVDLNQCEYFIQKRVELFLPTLQQLLENGANEEARVLVDRMIDSLLETPAKGFFDDDHLVLQNTGILNGYPIQIDVGRFYQQPGTIDATVIHQDLFDKTYLLRAWLNKYAPDLKNHLDNQLRAIIGEKLDTLQPHHHVYEQLHKI